jgi:hypothetical protein
MADPVPDGNDSRDGNGSRRGCQGASKKAQKRGAGSADSVHGSQTGSSAVGTVLGELRDAAAAHDEELPAPGLPRITEAE